jgi:hypothetical protein
MTMTGNESIVWCGAILAAAYLLGKLIDRAKGK